MALSEDGTVYGCGTFKDDVGSLSAFSASAKSQRTLVPVITPASPKERVRKLAVGARHCLALTEGGEVLTWGIGSQGQLGRVAQFDQVSEGCDS
jgi:regulator of chromosome condensation